MGFQVPTNTLIAAATAALGWIIWAERKFANVMTRAQHDEICENRQAMLENNLSEIKAMLVETNKEAREHRQRISAALDVASKEDQKYREKQSERLKSIEVRIAVLQTLRGHPPSGDTGNFSTKTNNG